jgi:hypothetical protein
MLSRAGGFALHAVAASPAAAAGAGLTAESALADVAAGGTELQAARRVMASSGPR